MSEPFQWLEGRRLRRIGAAVSFALIAVHLFLVYGHFLPTLRSWVHPFFLWKVFPANALLVLLFASFAGLVYGFWGGLAALVYALVVLAAFLPGLPGREATTRAVTEYFAQVISTISVGAAIYALNLVGAIARKRLRQALETLRAFQEERVRQERLAAIGQAVTAIAHDLRNSFTVITGYSELLENLLADPQALRALKHIRESAQNASRLVSDMRLFVGEAPLQLELVNLPALVGEVVAEDPRGLVFQIDIPDNLPPVRADRVQLMRVLTNLLDNARDALDGRPDGRVCITAGTTKDKVVLTVADNGPGVPPHLQEKVFEPFFTTKPAGKGTGLGLAICRSIVRRHGGSITLSGTPGGGATFTITLPVGEPAFGKGERMLVA